MFRSHGAGHGSVKHFFPPTNQACQSTIKPGLKPLHLFVLPWTPMCHCVILGGILRGALESPSGLVIPKSFEL